MFNRLQCERAAVLWIAIVWLIVPSPHSLIWIGLLFAWPKPFRLFAMRGANTIGLQ